MPTNDFQDLTQTPNPSPKKRFHYPGPDDTGALAWPAGQTFAQAIAGGLPAAIRNRILTEDATITIVIDVQQV